ncbi:hypothetical protein [Agrobacterium tumefaciens]|uniref:hypothetical protein n=1 Tax=Agrobacterium tumefaciens TaxID=358 RepID=UPI0013AF9574
MSLELPREDRESGELFLLITPKTHFKICCPEMGASKRSIRGYLMALSRFINNLIGEFGGHMDHPGAGRDKRAR